jgi:hypothetical protein
MRRVQKDIKTAWKQKIDPAFDKLNEPPRSKLRGILKNLKQLQLP